MTHAVIVWECSAENDMSYLGAIDPLASDERDCVRNISSWMIAVLDVFKVRGSTSERSPDS